MILMILYYTVSQKTKVFAQALSEVVNLPLYALTSGLGEKITFKFIFKSLYLAITGKPYPVDNMPDLPAELKEIYICTPVWGGQVAAPVWYFLNHGDLKNKKVHLLLTCESITAQDKYKKKALDTLDLIDCIPGMVYVFTTGKEPPDKELIAEQMRDMIHV
jgi:hypothetical protein